jgi:glycosyltransferase involved in cell wall biosynthesis
LKAEGYEARLFTFGDRNIATDEPDVVRTGAPAAFDNLVTTIARVLLRFIEPGKKAYHLAEVCSSAWPGIQLRHMISRFRPDVLILSDHGCPGLLIGKPPHCKTVLVSHHNPARFLNNPLWGLHSEVDARLTIACENRILRNVDEVICPSHYMKDMFVKTYRFAGPISVIPNLVDADAVAAITPRDLRSRLNLPDDALMVYIPSAGNPYKGSRFVFEIIRRIASRTSKDVGFYLSGTLNGELSHELRFVPSNAKIYAPGQSSYTDNLAMVKSCSFGVSPTLIENCGMAILEAACCGVPMVTFDVGGNAEVVAPGVSGLLVPYLDVEALVHAAARFMEEKYRLTLRREAVRYAAEKFGRQRIVTQYMQVIEAGAA